MRRNRLVRLWAAWIALVAVVGFIAPAPAFAGTLTSASATAVSPNNVTGASNSRYDYSFTTATAASLTKVSVGVPRGTDASNRYLDSSATSANYASTPDTPTNSMTGDFEIRVKANLNWNSGNGFILSKVSSSGASQKSYALVLSANTITLQRYTDCNGAATYTSDALGFADGTTQWVRATAQINNGSGLSVATFYQSTDGITWTQIGATKTSANVLPQCDSTTQVEIGSRASGTNGSLAGKYYYADVRNGIGGPIANKFDPSDDSATSPSGWTSSDSAAEPWTVNRSGSTSTIDIASDLTSSNVTGLPASGTAKYRFIDGIASYTFTSTSVPASTPCTLSLTGFTNTTVAGNYASPITTWTNSTAIDSISSPVLYIVAVANTLVSATIDPTFTFTVANQAAACNGESNFVSSGGSSTGVALGHVSSSANASAGQALTVASNAGGGFNVYVRGTQASQNLRSSSRNWTDVTGTYASPAALGSGEAFGYTYKDSTSSTSVTNPASAMFAALTGTNQAVMGSASSSNGNSCVSFDAQTAATTPAGTYSATIVYVAVPAF